ncbi:hypothetical protein BCF11_0573 [Collimonas sp. PA-H2]|uniref:hypothetical protein n=1 Tax=Collimonas sp. PA-H2 TaxID=1881062 RepID=UPI000BF7A548|nr:hypothetical protein [Collimonas sp. PA-H2]PFH08221.1 hypothetical protein BCF11_0573 [Collimonas sp. PA-H2]
MDSPTGSTTLSLKHDRSTLFHASRGTAIVSMRGKILIAAANECLTDITLASCTIIAEGECHVLQRSGWVRLQAGGAERAACLLMAPAENRLATLWQRWRRRTQAPEPC